MNLEHIYLNNLKTMNQKQAARETIKQGSQYMATLEEWEKAFMRPQFTKFAEMLDGAFGRSKDNAKVCDSPSYSVAC